MKIAIYGGGAVGLGIASCLLKAGGVHLDIVAREETVGLLNCEGLSRTGLFGDVQSSPENFQAYSSLTEIPPHVYDFILVCTKSLDSAWACEDLYAAQSLWSHETKIVLFQNGWGNAEIFSQKFPSGNIYNARVITGFRRPRMNQVDITVHADAIRMGSLFHQDLSCLEALCRNITAGGIPCAVTQDVQKDLWAKMLYNCALNPLGAIFQVAYGVLGEWEYTRHIMDAIIQEVFAVMQHAGYSTHWPTAEEYLNAFYSQLLPPTAEHPSSMLQDVLAHKKTEIDFLNGAVVQLAQRCGQSVPYNEMICNMIKFIEARNVGSS